MNARYYSADCYFRAEQYDKAISGYDFVIAQPRSSFTETSLLNAAWIHYRNMEYDKALADYEQLEAIAEVKDNILSAQAGQMRCQSKLGNQDKALECAQKIINGSTTDKDLLNEAHLITARTAFAKNDFTTAKSEYSVVAKRTNSAMTAESKYYLAMIEYKLGNYKESQKLIFEIQKQVPGYNYWIARGFILLGDDYLAQKDTFQAKETYKSIVDNYVKNADDPDDLRQIASSKLDELNATELKKNNDIMEQKLRNVKEPQDSSESN